MKVLFLIFLGVTLGIVCLPYLLFRQKDPPPGTNQASSDYRYSHAELLIDRTVWDPTTSGIFWSTGFSKRSSLRLRRRKLF